MWRALSEVGGGSPSRGAIVGDMTQGAVPHQFNSPTPAVAIVPGVVITALAVHFLVSDSLAWIGPFLAPIGAALLLVGVVAKGVEWGIALERQHRME